MKNSFRVYLKSTLLTLTVIFCLCFFIIGTSAAFKAIKQTAYAEYEGAFEITDKYIRIFDYKIKI